MQDLKQDEIMTRLASASEIEVIDEATFQDFKNRHHGNYDSMIISYAQRWARLMQLEMSKGMKLEDIAEITSQEADFDSIDGLMYLDAVVMLVCHWKYGEKFRCWHNFREQSRESRWQV